MPSFAEAIKRDIDRLKFAAEQVKKAPKKKAKKQKSPVTDKVLKHGRNLQLTIRQAAIELRQIQITYKKATSEVKGYRVAPYEWKNRKLKIGRRMVLYAYDMDDKHIKSFVKRGILKVEILEKKFRPKWPVAIA